MKFLWLTDIHINFLEDEERKKFYHEIINTKCEAILIGGDIAEGPSVSVLLKEIVDTIKKPIYFVLGNHDYYFEQIKNVKQKIMQLMKVEPLLKWLPACEPIKLKSGIILVGQDGWADGRYGDYANSTVSINDSRLITDLFQSKILGKYQLLEKMQYLADTDAQQLKEKIQQSISQFNPQKIIILTHVPPFKEACLYEGKISSDDCLPYFSSKATGDVLREFAEKNPTIEFLVLCGHTHGYANYMPLKNLTIKVGKAEYYKPELQLRGDELQYVILTI